MASTIPFCNLRTLTSKTIAYEDDQVYTYTSENLRIMWRIAMSGWSSEDIEKLYTLKKKLAKSSQELRILQMEERRDKEILKVAFRLARFLDNTTIDT